jgi:hypothetical protein
LQGRALGASRTNWLVLLTSILRLSKIFEVDLDSQLSYC